MASLELNGVRKAYGPTPVLDDLSLTLEAREFIAFLGPSGSGKSTLLRIIAGLETADAGEIWLEGRRIDGLAPGDRGVAMVFQHYALYPHMTVRDNMAFGLRNARVAKDEIETRVADAARVLEIEEHLDKKPGQLSGGPAPARRDRPRDRQGAQAVPARRAPVQPRRGAEDADPRRARAIAAKGRRGGDHGHS